MVLDLSQVLTVTGPPKVYADPDKILEFWPEVPIYPDENRKILDQVCARIRIKFCRDKITYTKNFRHVHISAVFLSIFRVRHTDDTVMTGCDKYPTNIFFLGD